MFFPWPLPDAGIRKITEGKLVAVHCPGFMGDATEILSELLDA
jgi:protoheme ferro-lyase